MMQCVRRCSFICGAVLSILLLLCSCQAGAGQLILPDNVPSENTSYNKIVVFIDRSPAECYNKFRMLWIGGTSPTAKTVFGRLQPQLLC